MNTALVYLLAGGHLATSQFFSNLKLHEWRASNIHKNLTATAML